MRSFPFAQMGMRLRLAKLRLRLKRRAARSAAGETLVETLVAVLISVLAVLVLVTSTVTAATLNRSAELADARMASDLNMVEARTAATQAPAQASIVTEEGVLGTYDVTVFTGDNGQFNAYEGGR